MYTDPQYVNNLSGSAFAIRVVNGTDTSFIPLDENNSDYQEIMKLVNSGYLTIAPADTNETIPNE